MNSKAFILALCAAPLLAGCATYGSVGAGKLDPADFGEANRQTYSAMIVNPNPQYEEDLTTDASTTSNATKRYRDGQVKEPVSTSTTGGPG